jgi:protein-disulfide isomerase
MPSGKKARQQRQAAARTPPPVRSKGSPRGARQASPRALAIGGAILLLVVVAIVLGIVLSKGSGGGTGDGLGDGPKLILAAGTPAVGSATGPDALLGATDVAKLFKDIPENGLELGQPNAPVEMMVFIDLQCPNCQIFDTQQLPALIQKYVRPGKLRIKVEPWSILDRTSDQHDSDRGQKATIAAAAQNKAFELAEVLYYNQPPGSEGTGWMNDAMISQAAASVDGLKTAQLIDDANSGATASTVSQVDSLASSLTAKDPGFTGTPGIFLAKGNGQPKLFASGVPDLGQLEHAIDALLT